MTSTPSPPMIEPAEKTDHDLGHVARKHSPRRVLQSVGIGVRAGLLSGERLERLR